MGHLHPFGVANVKRKPAAPPLELVYRQSVVAIKELVFNGHDQAALCPSTRPVAFHILPTYTTWNNNVIYRKKSNPTP
jgi:hypothetical protein